MQRVALELTSVGLAQKEGRANSKVEAIASAGKLIRKTHSENSSHKLSLQGVVRFDMGNNRYAIATCQLLIVAS